MSRPAVLERMGLFAINAMARSAPYSVKTVSTGKHPRQGFDWYQIGLPAPPTVIFFYGGNWRSGRREDYRFVADTLAVHGIETIIPDYRLFPEVTFDHLFDDAVTAAAAALEQLDDGRPVFLMGHSAGAQIAALLTLGDALGERSKIRGMIGMAGPYDFYPFTEDDHFTLFGPEERFPLSQPVNFVRADAPPLYLLHGREDARVRRGHSKSLMEKQNAAGGCAKREVYDDMGHVDIVLEFIRLRRGRSTVVRDVHTFIRSLANAAAT